MVQRILTWSFYTLFCLTPFVWNPNTSELFEYNKMMLVYLLTVIITACWLIKMVKNQKLILRKTPLDIPLMLFLLANILSTVFSVDVHTSIWGYYSRSNGGLLSLISYLILYYALVSNFQKDDVPKFLKATVWAAIPISLWAIWEHFGVSLSCVIMVHQFIDSCWVQDVQSRVFATMGQPNWLAAYLGMVIFPAFYFLLKAKTKFSLTLNSLFLILIYLAFTFTYSRGATLGLSVGLLIFFICYFLPYLPLPTKRIQQQKLRVELNSSFLILPAILALFLILNLLFGSALTNFKLLSKFAGPERPSISLNKNLPSGTQLENGGTESGQIRLIVWKGALEIFKRYPLFGSGVETFAYAYYGFRPAEHNLVSEWDFLYNKAHNEYLNYLATTGLFGFASYLAVILTFIAWTVKRILNHELSGKDKKIASSSLMLIALLAADISYLAQNFFSFSVVVIALFFYLFPGLAFLGTEEKLKEYHLPFTTSWFIQRKFYSTLSLWIICIMATIFTFKLHSYWTADTLYAKGSQANDQGIPGRAYNDLTDALELNSGEPLYRSELAYAAAGASVALTPTDATTAAKLKIQSQEETSRVLASDPNNVSFWRTAIRTYFLLSTADSAYLPKTLETLDQTIKLAPTDPKLTYNKALILGQMKKNHEAVEALKKTIELKPNYRDAHFALGNFYYDLKEKDKAADEMKTVLKLIPNDPDALKKLEEWQEK
jgi:putative inorganic carbon (hco3(-)) transporter